MSDYDLFPAAEPRADEAPSDSQLQSASPPEPAVAPDEGRADFKAPSTLPFNRHAEAGRMGAHRIHQLIRLGHLYEEEHGLKRGRQRLKQLIQLGKRYEVEHGLAAPSPLKRRGKAQIWADFLRVLAEVVKPAYRRDLERLLRPTGPVTEVEQGPAAK